ncbi:huntingtin-interacting protein K [Trichonephila inaurata madagascariensis]|uniref:Huntingtin-interacting protein K n=1 Tax=Trichonephila inaurata madagascariensis TaxID=2747483 RepID=A0A8X6YXG1_9ARAC|nr:huntingtin-interacting protein K [Trichonephila inaurata madagascariensis]
MAVEFDENTSNDDQKPQKKVAKHDSGAADLEKVTDYVEEKEISSQDIIGAMSLIGDKHSKETAEKAARQKELAKVIIKKEDVELIMHEMEISRNLAELKLREHYGNIVEALTELTN